jgi:hypothetical protein
MLCFDSSVVILIMLGEEYFTTNRHMKPTFTSQLSFFILWKMLKTWKVVRQKWLKALLLNVFTLLPDIICNLMLFRKL